MTEIDMNALERAAAQVILPYLDRPAADARVPVTVDAAADPPRVTYTVGFPVRRAGPEIAAAAAEQLATFGDIRVDVESRIQPHAAQSALAPLPNVSNVVAVASAKGGVGKSTTAVNLAAALQAAGARVGILDADIYGPSQPTMLGLAGQNPVSRDGKSFEPLAAFGLQVISIGFLVDQDRPVIWRGPMVTQALNQLLFSTNWDELDYLIVDLPPGTGDTQLTLTQKVPLAGALIITTPQEIALLDARRGLRMFEKVGVPVLGVIENMSTFICPDCGHEAPLFGTGGGRQLSEEAGVPLLGQLPFDLRIREEADGGHPTVISDPDSTLAARYVDIATRAAAGLSLMKADLGGRLPKVVVE